MGRRCIVPSFHRSTFKGRIKTNGSSLHRDALKPVVPSLHRSTFKGRIKTSGSSLHRSIVASFHRCIVPSFHHLLLSWLRNSISLVALKDIYGGSRRTIVPSYHRFIVPSCHHFACSRKKFARDSPYFRSDAVIFQLSTPARSTVYIESQFPATGHSFSEPEDARGLFRRRKDALFKCSKMPSSHTNSRSQPHNVASHSTKIVSIFHGFLDVPLGDAISKSFVSS